MNFNKKSLVSSAIIVTAVLAITLISFFNKPVRVEISKDRIKIPGLYGVDLKMEDISEVALKETLPEEMKRDNLKKSGSISVGNFNLNNEETARLVTYSKEGPYIYITTKNNNTKHLIINYGDREHTEDLYKIISNNIKK